jgi:hypothetical protein
MNIKKALGFSQAEPVVVDPKNRFYYMLQQMQANRWKITAIVLGLFTLIIVGIIIWIQRAKNKSLQEEN